MGNTAHIKVPRHPGAGKTTRIHEYQAALDTGLRRYDGEKTYVFSIMTHSRMPE